MMLRRSGSKRFCGWDVVIPEKTPRLKWDDDAGELILQAWNIQSANGHYDYNLRLSPDDIAGILQLLAEHISEPEAQELVGALKPIASDLFKLLSATAGLFPPSKKVAQ